MKIAETIGEKIEVHRIMQRQKHRNNYKASSTEEYYRKYIFITFLDLFISALTDKF